MLKQLQLSYVEKFGVGKIGKLIESHSPIFYMLIVFSVVAIRVAHSPIFYPPIGSD